MAFSLRAFTDGVAKLQEITKELSEIELKGAILEQKELLLDAKEEILRLREVVSELKADIANAALKETKLSGLIEVHGFKFDEVDGNPTGLAFCPKCEVKEDGKLYRLIRMNDQYSECPNCSVSYNVGSSGRVHEKLPPMPVRKVSIF